VRRKALTRLGGNADARLLDSVLVCLKDEDAGVRCAAIEAIERLKVDHSGVCLITMLQDSCPLVRKVAATVLGRLGETRSIDGLGMLLKDSDDNVRLAAANSLKALGWRPSSNEDEARFEIALGNAKAAARAGGAAVQALVKELKHDTSFVRRAVAEALEDLDDPRMMKPLLEALGDEDPTVRVSVIHALSKVNSEGAAAALLTRLSREKDPRVRLAAAEVLGKRNDPGLVPAFVGLLSDSNFEVRVSALRFLGRNVDQGVAQDLARMLKDVDSDVRQAAAQALCLHANPTGIEALTLALGDEDRGVRSAAKLALEKIDDNWFSTEAAQRARVALEASLKTRPAWVKADITRSLAMLGSTVEAATTVA